jgi:hypothetical protein
MNRFVRVCVGVALALGTSWLVACGTSTPASIGSTPASAAASSPAAPAGADLQVKEGVHAILVGLQSWAVGQDTAHYPRRADEATLTEAMSGAGEQWPVNPFSGVGMKPGDQPGDYVYDLAKDRKSCRVTAYLSDGSAYSPQVLRCD